MIKGCEKRVIHIKSPKSDIFEEAYLILKDADHEGPSCDIVREAERLLSESEAGAKHRLSFGWDEICFFFSGDFSFCIILFCSVAFSLRDVNV